MVPAFINGLAAGHTVQDVIHFKLLAGVARGRVAEVGIVGVNREGVVLHHRGNIPGNVEGRAIRENAPDGLHDDQLRSFVRRGASAARLVIPPKQSSRPQANAMIESAKVFFFSVIAVLIHAVQWFELTFRFRGAFLLSWPAGSHNRWRDEVQFHCGVWRCQSPSRQRHRTGGPPISRQQLPTSMESCLDCETVQSFNPGTTVQLTRPHLPFFCAG